MEDKYKLSLKENIFLAKKLLVQSIYDSAKLEGCNVTFPQTETILNGVSVAGLKMSDVEKILNLRDAWEYLFRTIEESITLEYWNKINSFVARNESLDWGVLRYGEVGISGTSYRPTLPIQEDIINKINTIIYSHKTDTYSYTERSIDLFLYGCKAQNYWDGNKRTSIIIANKFLIQKGAGILSIPEDDLEQFGVLLSNYYETDERARIKNYLYENAIKGMTINREIEKKYKQESKNKTPKIR